MKTVISAEPSVCSQEMSFGTLRNSMNLPNEIAPERSSTQSTGIIAISFGGGNNVDIVSSCLRPGMGRANRAARQQAHRAA